MIDRDSYEALNVIATDISRQIDMLPDRLRRARVSGGSEDGSVIAHANGIGELMAIEIDIRAARSRGVQRLGELIVSSIEKAEMAATEYRDATLAEIADSATAIFEIQEGWTFTTVSTGEVHGQAS